MKSIYILLILALGSLPLSTEAQKMSPAQSQKLEQLYKYNSILYFKFDISSDQEVAALRKIINIDKGTGKTLYAHASKQQFAAFLVRNYAYTVLPHPRKIKKVRAGTSR
jgi:hypothetical protein